MDLAQIIVAFANEISVVLWRLLFALGGVVGTVYIGSALLRLQRASAIPGQSSVTFGDILPVIFVAALMVNMSRFINVVWNSIGTGTVTFGPLSYSGADDFGRFGESINAVLTLASMAGGMFFFKGLLLLKRATVEGRSSNGSDDSVWRAINHMVWGSMLAQIPDVIDAFRTSLHLFW